MPYKVFQSGYNTAIIRSTKAAAQKAARKQRPGARIVSTQKTTASENRAIKAGRWVRTRRDGSPPPKAYSGPRGHGPSASASRKAVANRRRK